MLKCPRFGLRGHHESEVTLQEDADQKFRRVVSMQSAIGDKLTNAAALDDGVVVALDDLGLVHQITGHGVIPTRLRIVLPREKSSGPG